MDQVVFLYTIWPDAKTAEAAAVEAVAGGLAACANLLAPMRSIYRWRGAVEQAEEIRAIFKPTAARASALTALLVARHPYDTPAIAALPVIAAGSHAAFLSWICSETTRDRG